VIPRFPVYLFDIDGTLLDSAADICGAILEALNGRPCATPSFDYLKSFIGRNLADCFQDLFPHYTAEQLAELAPLYRAAYQSRRHSGTKVYAGVAEGLAVLPGLKSTATTKGTPTTRAVLEQFGLLQHFDHVQGTDGIPAKPEPNVILAALQALGRPPEECLMVGDSPVDIEAGRRAGVKTCAVRYGYGDPAAIAKAGPDYWVNDLRELAGA
jgi:phosphoglycolate phosphatase